jgi:DNA mismatch repair protein MutS2
MDTHIDPHTLAVLEFDKVSSLLCRFAASELGRRVCEKIVPLTNNPSAIRSQLKEVTQMKQLIKLHGTLPLEDVQDIALLLNKIQPLGVFLSSADFLAIKTLITASRLTKTMLGEADVPFAALAPLVSGLKYLKELESAISRCIGIDGEIVDRASPALRRIRGRVQQSKGRIKSRLQNIANHYYRGTGRADAYITLRNERYVIPVRSDYKHRVPGVVHDQSKQHATYFVEPFDVVDLNNAILLLKQDEKEEELTILKSLTDTVRNNNDHLRENQRCLAILDGIQAKARLSIAMEAREPEVGQDGDIHIIGARHPLLLHRGSNRSHTEMFPTFDNPAVVPIELLFPRQFPISVITGANMGGKTAALKTLGLLTLMVQAGMHIPAAEGSRVAVWKRIFADIGDEQSLEESVSTFSSHLNNVIQILGSADEKSLVLLDELGCATDPQQGAALALAIVEQLNRQEAKVMLTTHLSLLKEYAITTPKVLTTSVAFDTQTLRPQYELIYGVPGTSMAFETAARLGIDSNILKQADSYLGESDRQSLLLIQQLRGQLEAIAQVQTRLRELLDTAKRYEDSLCALSKRLSERKADLSARMEKKAKALFREVDFELRQAMKACSTATETQITAVKHRVEALKKDFSPALPSREHVPQDLGVLKAGDHLMLGKGGRKARVIDVDTSSNTVEVQVGSMKVKAHVDDLAQIEGAMKQGKTPSKSPSASWSPPAPVGAIAPLNVIGLTVDEALPLVEKAVDNALLAQQKELKIIHGLGTGRLQKAIHEHLGQQSGIRTYYLADPAEGGAAVTFVEIDL